MAKKIKFEIDLGQDNTVIAISCHKKDYWLAFQLNEQLGFDFRRTDDLPFYNSRLKEIIRFPLFYCQNSDEQLFFYLVSNYNPDSKLFPDLNTSDYFFLINGILPNPQKQELLSGLRKIKGVLVAFEPGLKNIKDYYNFLSDLELHMIEVLKIKN